MTTLSTNYKNFLSKIGLYKTFGPVDLPEIVYRNYRVNSGGKSVLLYLNKGEMPDQSPKRGDRMSLIYIINAFTHPIVCGGLIGGRGGSNIKLNYDHLKYII